MSSFFLVFLLSLVVYGVLAFVGLVAGIGPVGPSRRGRGARLVCLVISVLFGIWCTSYGGAAFAGTASAAALVFIVVMLRSRFY